MGDSHRRLKKYRAEAFKRQRGLCYWCQQPMIEKTRENREVVWSHPRACTADHLILKSEGGGVSRKNIVAACRECNNKRHWSAHGMSGEPLATLADVWPKAESI